MVGSAPDSPLRNVAQRNSIDRAVGDTMSETPPPVSYDVALSDFADVIAERVRRPSRGRTVAWAASTVLGGVGVGLLIARDTGIGVVALCFWVAWILDRDSR